MNARRTDLLAVTRGFVRFGQVMLIVWMLVATAIFIGLLNGTEKPMHAFTGTLGTMDPEAALYAVKVGVVGAFVAGALLFPLLQELIRLIDSARIGDPFVPESGKRLRRIGWLLVAFNVCVSVSISLALSGSVRLPMTSFSGWLTVLLVFVLARIFEQGTRMRAELQETV
jgi:Protein of unknown function (DUF2975)